MSPRRTWTARLSHMTCPAIAVLRSADDDEAVLEEEVRGFDAVDVDPGADVSAAAVLEIPELVVVHGVGMVQDRHLVARHGVDTDLRLGRQVDEMHLVRPRLIPRLAAAERVRHHRDTAE